jgi:hypothetical protein
MTEHFVYHLLFSRKDLWQKTLKHALIITFEFLPTCLFFRGHVKCALETILLSKPMWLYEGMILKVHTKAFQLRGFFHALH